MTHRLVRSHEQLRASQREVVDANDQLLSQNDRLHQANEILEQLSITDGLTRLHNHRFFQDTLVREAKRADRTYEPLALILADIDHFKQWNDRLGHAAGDEILRRVAELMNTLVRETDLLARYGGEEFAILLPNTEIEGAVALAQKIRAEVAGSSFLLNPPSERQSVTISLGVSAYAGDRGTLFNEADGALYLAKDSGRDCVMVADPDSIL
jgi:two-component system cell cycle response regulator